MICFSDAMRNEAHMHSVSLSVIPLFSHSYPFLDLHCKVKWSFVASADFTCDMSNISILFPLGESAWKYLEIKTNPCMSILFQAAFWSSAAL